MNNPVDNISEIGSVSGESSGLAKVGASLKDARIKKNMRVDEVAKHLHLGTDVVHAIESGSTDELPGTAFTRGYVRSYVRLLGLNEEQLLSELGVIAGERKIHLTQSKPIAYRKQYPLGKWLSWFVASVVVIGVLFLAIPVFERLFSNNVGKPSDSPKLIIPGQSDVGSSLPLQKLTEKMMVEKIAFSSSKNSSDVIPASETKKLVLNVRQNCWVEVKFNGKKQLAGIVKKGQKKVFDAMPPVELLLGNAPAVTVEYGGKVFNHSRYTKGKVARFSLD